MATKTKKSGQKGSQAKTKITKQTYLYWYELMQRLRQFENQAAMLYQRQKIRGFLHLYIGQEAVAAGVMSATKKEDPVITAYRDHGIGIAKGVTAKEGMAELYGKSTGCAKGKGGSMHFFSKENNFYGGHGIVGGHIPLGAGIALSEKYRNTDHVTICLFGDGAVNQGQLHETFNMAALWKLPVVFICENNQYAMGTPVDQGSIQQDLYKYGETYDIPSQKIDGMVCEEVHDAVEEGVQRARSGDGPSYIEAKTYRYKGHSISDPATYRTREELETYREKDPIILVKKTIVQKKYASQQKLDEIDQQAKDEVKEAVEFAENSEYPAPEEQYKEIYTQEDYPFIRE